MTQEQTQKYLLSQMKVAFEIAGVTTRGFLRIRKEFDKYPTMLLNCEEISNGFLATISYLQQKTSLKDVGKEILLLIEKGQ
ncbi:MAG: hypothetical protein LBU51_06590 [Bacteroidales bacterium]|jgi:hypothetical protein|nr:hypothetical protein [Bacteroidales bacterium]